VTLIDCIEKGSNLVQDETNLRLVQDNWIDKLETLDAKTGLNWRDRKSNKKLPGDKKMYRLKSWTSDETEEKSSTNFQKSSIPKTFGSKQKSLSSTFSGSFQSLKGSSVKASSMKTSSSLNASPSLNASTKRRKSPTNDVKACLKELELFGSIKVTTDKNTLIETVKYLNDQLKKSRGEKSADSSKSNAASPRTTDSKPLKFPKLEKST
jgi:hypothetical protein